MRFNDALKVILGILKNLFFDLSYKQAKAAAAAMIVRRVYHTTSICVNEEKREREREQRVRDH
jgi:hypothetical protein